jgi:hypothetical protein
VTSSQSHGETWVLEGSPYGFRCPLLKEGRTLKEGEVVTVVSVAQAEMTCVNCGSRGTEASCRCGYARELMTLPVRVAS